MFIIQRLWYCPLENRDPIAWHTVGYVTTKEEADRIISLDVFNTSISPYPLETYLGKNKLISRYRIKADGGVCLDGLSQDLIERVYEAKRGY